MRPNDIKKVIEVYGNLNFGDLQKLLHIEEGSFKTWEQAKLKLVRIA